MKETSSLFRLLGDEARLRILRLLQKRRLNVSELTSILGIAQPGVSRHLRLLREGGLVEEERERGWTYYRVRRSQGRTWRFLRQRIRELPGKQDDARLQEVLRQRQELFLRDSSLEPGRSWAAWSRALGHLLPRLRVADLACGEGYLAIEMSRWAERIVAVDRSAESLSRARARANEKGAANISWKKGELENLPLEKASFDAAILCQALHHAQDPLRALREAARIVVPGGTVLVLDLKAHEETWVKKLGDRWLGFEEAALRRLMRDAGLRNVRLEIGARRKGDPFQVLVASGRKAGR